MTDSIKFKLVKVLFTPNPKENYEKYSSDYILWFSRSADLSDAADIIGEEIYREIEKVKPKSAIEVQITRKKTAVRMFPIYLMLKGYALETLLKGFCVLKNDGWNKKFRGHDLVKLANQITLKFSTDEKKILRHLTRFVEWGGRYPTPIEPAKYKDGGLNDGEIVGKEEFSVNWTFENYRQFTINLGEIFIKANKKITQILRNRRQKEMFADLLRNIKELIPRELNKWFAKADKKAETMSEKEKVINRTFLFHALYGRLSKNIAKELGKSKLSEGELESLSERLKNFIREQGF